MKLVRDGDEMFTFSNDDIIIISFYFDVGLFQYLYGVNYVGFLSFGRGKVSVNTTFM